MKRSATYISLDTPGFQERVNALLKPEGIVVRYHSHSSIDPFIPFSFDINGVSHYQFSIAFTPDEIEGDVTAGAERVRARIREIATAGYLERRLDDELKVIEAEYLEPMREAQAEARAEYERAMEAVKGFASE